MFENLLNIPYYLGKDAALVDVLKRRAPNNPLKMHCSYVRQLKRRRPKLTVSQLEEYLDAPAEYKPVFDATLEFRRDVDGAVFSADTLWCLDGHVHAPSADDAELMKFLKVGKKSSCEITVALKEDPTVSAMVELGKHAFFTPDVDGLQAWFAAHEAAEGRAQSSGQAEGKQQVS